MADCTSNLALGFMQIVNRRNITANNTAPYSSCVYRAFRPLSYKIPEERSWHKIVGPKTWRIFSRNHSNNEELIPTLAFITTGQAAILSINDIFCPPWFLTRSLRSEFVFLSFYSSFSLFFKAKNTGIIVVLLVFV